MSLFWLTVNLVLGSHTPWARPDRRNRMTARRWVSHFLFSLLLFFRCHLCLLYRKISLSTYSSLFVGIVPRAAQLLFEILDGSRHTRTQSSGLRAPARYSMASPASLVRDKNWQIKATYVEVCSYRSVSLVTVYLSLTTVPSRFIMSNFEIC